MTSSPNITLLTREEAASHLSVSTRTLDRLGITKVKLGRATRYLVEDLAAFVQASKQDNTPVSAIAPSARSVVPFGRPVRSKHGKDWKAEKLASIEAMG